MNISICRNCGAQITWLKSREGKNIPVDISCITSANIKATVYQKGAFVCHFDTCSNRPPKVEQPGASATLKQDYPQYVRPDGATGGPRASAEEEYRSMQHGMAKSGEREEPEPPPMIDDEF